MASRIFIFSIVLGAKYLSYVKSIETHARAVLTINILSIGTVQLLSVFKKKEIKEEIAPTYSIIMYFMLLIYMPILYQIFEMYQIIQQSTVVEGVIDKNIPSVRYYYPTSFTIVRQF